VKKTRETRAFRKTEETQGLREKIHIPRSDQDLGRNPRSGNADSDNSISCDL